MFIQAFGTTASWAACKNPAAREVIDTVKKVVEHLHKSNLMEVRDVGGSVGCNRVLNQTEFWVRFTTVSRETGKALLRRQFVVTCRD